MNCHEAAEFVSALYDGETIPRSAAEHIGACRACEQQLRDYLEIGVELRRIASLETVEEAPPLILEKREAWSINWWQKGWGTMRIPRFAFAALLAAVAVLGSSLAVVGVRVHAHAQGTVVLLRNTLPLGLSFPCALSTIDKKQNSCGYVGEMNGGWIVYGVELLSSAGDTVELGIRSRFIARSSTETANSGMIDTLPEATYSFEPGKNLEVNIPGAGKLTINGEWTDHIPASIAGTNEVDPGPGEVRIISPLLLLDKKVVGDMQGGLASVDKPGEAVSVFFPGQGLFQLSLTQLPGAVQGTVELNRVRFESEGHSYTMVTGAPIARDAQLWVAHSAGYQPGQDAKGGFISAGFPDKVLNPPAAEK